MIFMNRIWITGYRSYELNVFKDDEPKVKIIKSVLENYLRGLLEQSDEEFWIITGPQMGTERWAAEIGLKLKTDFQQVKVAIIFPFAEFGQQWNENNQLKLAGVADQVDFTGDVSDKPYQSPQQLRNYQQFMLTHTDEALFLYDLEHEGKTKYDYRAAEKYSEENQYNIELIDFDELQEAANEWEERQREKYDF